MDRRGFDRLLTTGRWLVLLVVALSATLEHIITTRPDSVLYPLIFGVVYNGAKEIILQRGSLTPRVRMGSIAIDLLLVTWIVSITGGINSTFFDTYYLAIISSGLQYSIAGAMSAGGAAMLMLLALEFLNETGRQRLSDIGHVFATFPYLLLTALAVGVLSSQLRREADRRRQAELQSRELELEQQQNRREMEVARAVQATLMPSEAPVVAGLSVAARSVSSHDIGGDLYDFNDNTDGTFSVSVIDVSGHGTAAALALSGLKTALDTARRLPPQEVLHVLNRHMLERTPEYMFATMIICSFDPARRLLRVSSAGHEPLVLVRAGGALETLQPQGLPLGIEKSAEYAVLEWELQPGDTVILYTDGITEAPCGDSRLQYEGLAEILSAHGPGGAEAVVNAVMDAVVSFGPAHDDATIVAIRVEPQ